MSELDCWRCLATGLAVLSVFLACRLRRMDRPATACAEEAETARDQVEQLYERLLARGDGTAGGVEDDDDPDFWKRGGAGGAV